MSVSSPVESPTGSPSSSTGSQPSSSSPESSSSPASSSSPPSSSSSSPPPQAMRRTEKTTNANSNSESEWNLMRLPPGPERLPVWIAMKYRRVARLIAQNAETAAVRHYIRFNDIVEFVATERSAVALADGSPDRKPAARPCCDSHAARLHLNGISPIIRSPTRGGPAMKFCTFSCEEADTSRSQHAACLAVNGRSTARFWTASSRRGCPVRRWPDVDAPAREKEVAMSHRKSGTSDRRRPRAIARTINTASAASQNPIIACLAVDAIAVNSAIPSDRRG